jgi:hypothetical protein
MRQQMSYTMEDANDIHASIDVLCLASSLERAGARSCVISQSDINFRASLELTRSELLDG